LAPEDPIADLVERAEHLVASGRRGAAIDLLVKARKTHPQDPRLPYHAGLLYMDQMWWADGLKQLHAAIVLDPSLKNDHALIAAVVNGFDTTAQYDWTLATFLRQDIGAPAKAALADVAASHPNSLVRKRAAAELRRY
jgi:hypothetical protein